MARISVVVPIYDVEPYLDECLRSIAGQTHADLEVVMVDDGSTDSSAAIAERFARRDSRFTLIRQPNGGLGRARNTGLRAAGGEYLAFADSDDVLPADAYERLLASLERTGSDFATGNVARLTSEGCAQAAFLARTFARTRERTHVRRFAPLLADRTAWNKLWRRGFWDGHGLRFPEGRLHEDIPVVVPAHFLARTVDVVSAPVYRYRVRESGAPSITQRRHELRALRDRLEAVEHVQAFLADRESPRQRLRYERSVVAADLRYHLDLLRDASDEYRHLFLERAGAFLDGAGRGVCDGLPALERLKWHLVERRLLPELLEVLRYQQEEALATPPLRARRRYYGDFPFRADPRLRIPRSLFRLGRRDRELALTAHLEELGFDDGKLRLRGHAFVNALGARHPDSQRVAIAAVRPGRWRPLRLRFAARRLPTAPGRRADLERRLAWSGFSASLDPGDLRERDGEWTDGRWDLFAYVRTGDVRRRRARFEIAGPDLVRTIELPGPDDALLRATVRADGSVSVDVRTRWLRIERHRVLGGALLELEGYARHAGPALELTRSSDRLSLSYPLRPAADGAFTLRVPLAALRNGAEWEVGAAGGTPVVLASTVDGAAWRAAGRDMELGSTPAGAVRLLERPAVPGRVPAGEPALADAAAR